MGSAESELPVVVEVAQSPECDVIRWRSSRANLRVMMVVMAIALLPATILLAEFRDVGFSWMDPGTIIALGGAAVIGVAAARALWGEDVVIIGDAQLQWQSRIGRFAYFTRRYDRDELYRLAFREDRSEDARGMILFDYTPLAGHGDWAGWGLDARSSWEIYRQIKAGLQRRGWPTTFCELEIPKPAEFRFSLRSLLIAVTVLCCVLGCLVAYLH